MSYITAIGTANPPNRFSQSRIADFMMRAMKLNNGDARKLRTIFRATGIEFRHSVLEDYGRVKDFTFFPDTEHLEPFPATDRRLEMFRRNALALSLASFKDLMKSVPELSVKDITHLIVVCCTGMYAPGLDIDLVHALKLASTVQRTAINFMGCHASFNALRIADVICRNDPQAKVLVFCTELCSLHFQREASEDNLLANALFADGAASVLVEGEPRKQLQLRVEDFHSDLAPDGARDMAWTVGNLGFEMRLSSYVPDLIRNGIAAFTDSLLKKLSVGIGDIRHFAIHPGGRKILQVIEEELGLPREKNEAAYHVLRNYGNMSSPTVLFVLRRVLSAINGSDEGQHVLALAFGPGLTLESMALRIEHSTGHA